MKRTIITLRHEGEKTTFHYSIKKATHWGLIHMERFSEDGGKHKEYEIILTRINGWYHISCPDMGITAPNISTISDYGLIVDIARYMGFWNPDVEAIALAILELAEQGF